MERIFFAVFVAWEIFILERIIYLETSLIMIFNVMLQIKSFSFWETGLSKRMLR
jgi:hypothetical protein